VFNDQPSSRSANCPEEVDRFSPQDPGLWIPSDTGLAGYGLVELEQVAGRTAITQCRANSPLKLLTPRSPGSNAWVFSSTYGGGLVEGDAIGLEVRAGAYTRCVLTTQASTKIYRSETLGCRQKLNLTARSHAIVVSMPDPITCFAGARFEQRQRFDLAESAGLVMLDWFTSGRKARGERWNFQRYRSCSEIFVEGKCVFRDVLLLDVMDGAIDGQMRMGRVDCCATVVIVGPPFERVADGLLKLIAASPARGSGSVLFAASAIAGGVVLRVAGGEVEEVGKWLQQSLTGIEPIVGQNPWMRKW
jgi:urease accessory protein